MKTNVVNSIYAVNMRKVESSTPLCMKHRIKISVNNTEYYVCSCVHKLANIIDPLLNLRLLQICNIQLFLLNCFWFGYRNDKKNKMKMTWKCSSQRIKLIHNISWSNLFGWSRYHDIFLATYRDKKKISRVCLSTK